jgi:methyltransferase-like protein
MNDITFIPITKPDLINQDVDGETLILNNQGAEIHQLNEVASFIWGQCDGQHSIDDIAQLLLQHYSVSQQQATIDVAEIIEQFKTKGLLE